MWVVFMLVFTFISANPAPMCMASWTGHVIATTIFVGWSLAAWAFCYLICNCPYLEGSWPFIMAFACMPNIATFKASSLATLTDGPVSANARFPYYFTTVRLWTPLQFFVFPYTHIFLDDLKLLCYCFRTKPLDLICLVQLRTFMLHAG